MLYFEKIGETLNLKEYNEMNFIREEKVRKVEEEGDQEMGILKGFINGTYLDRLDSIEVFFVDSERIAVVFSGYGGLVGFKLININ